MKMPFEKNNYGFERAAGSHSRPARDIASLRPGSRRAASRGATMVSVMLLVASLLTVGLLVVRSSTRELKQAGALVARERALLAAQATLDLGAARLRREVQENPDHLSKALLGYYPPSSPGYCKPGEDCVPGVGDGTPVTGQRNQTITGRSDCAGRPCMRHGAVAVLDDAAETPIPWATIPLASLLNGADPEAEVSLWVRNNASEALGTVGNGWTMDTDRVVVLTAMARIRNTEVAIQQEIELGQGGTIAWNMPTPDEGYGGGHNNDNAAVEVCQDHYAGAEG